MGLPLLQFFQWQHNEGDDTVRKFLLLALVFMITLSIPAEKTWAEGTTLAFYSLNQTAVDLTGNCPEANIVNAPYLDGGVYLNGNYVGSDPDSAMVQTPSITMLDFSAVSVRIDFKIDALPARNRPILFCGQSWRWMGATLNSSGNIQLSYNGYPGLASTETVTACVWHTLAMVYDGTTGHLLVDGVEWVKQDFVPTHGEDRRFVTQNGSNGTAFKGYVRNLVVYNGVVPFVADVDQDELPQNAYLLGNHPNPFNPETTIRFDLPDPAAITLVVYDLAGHVVKVLIRDEMLRQGPHELGWTGTDNYGRMVPSGTYIARLEAGDVTTTTRMMLLK